MTRRFQFSLRGLLALTLGVSCFCAGMVADRQLNRPVAQEVPLKCMNYFEVHNPPETITMPDGTEWLRIERITHDYNFEEDDETP